MLFHTLVSTSRRRKVAQILTVGERFDQNETLDNTKNLNSVAFLLSNLNKQILKWLN